MARRNQFETYQIIPVNLFIPGLVVYFTCIFSPGILTQRGPQRAIAAAFVLPPKDDSLVNEAIYPSPRSSLETIRLSLPGSTRGIQMIALKVVALTLGVGIAWSVYSGDFGTDVILAIVACLS